MPTVEKLNFRFSEHHINRLADLSCQTGLTKTDVLRLLLDQAEVLMPNCVGQMAAAPILRVGCSGQIVCHQQDASGSPG